MRTQVVVQRAWGTGRDHHARSPPRPATDPARKPGQRVHVEQLQRLDRCAVWAFCHHTSSSEGRRGGKDAVVSGGGWPLPSNASQAAPLQHQQPSGRRGPLSPSRVTLQNCWSYRGNFDRSTENGRCEAWRGVHYERVLTKCGFPHEPSMSVMSSKTHSCSSGSRHICYSQSREVVCKAAHHRSLRCTAFIGA